MVQAEQADAALVVGVFDGLPRSAAFSSFAA